MIDKIRDIGNLFFILVVGVLIIIFLYHGAKTAQVTANVILNEEEKGITSEIKQAQEGLRFNHKNLSYKIDEYCEENSILDLLRAFDIVSKQTSLSFYETNYSTDISVFCSDLNNSNLEQDISKLAEGGPTLIANNEILEGKIILYTNNSDLNCNLPLKELHEIFHVLGFEHTLKQGSVMYPILNCNQQIDSEIMGIINTIYSSSSS